jgi:hypothetical protein
LGQALCLPSLCDRKISILDKWIVAFAKISAAILKTAAARDAVSIFGQLLD